MSLIQTQQYDNITRSSSRDNSKKIAPRPLMPPPTLCNYTETNSSRLRHQSRGMSVSGLIRVRQSIQYPSSPLSKSSVPSSNYSKSASISGTATPTSRRSGNAIKSEVISPTPSKTSCCVPPGSDDQRIKKVYANGSKCSDSVKNASHDTATPSLSSNGKPIITSITKKLTIRRDKIFESQNVECEPTHFMATKTNEVAKRPTNFLKKGSGSGNAYSTAAVLKNDVNSRIISPTNKSTLNVLRVASANRYPRPSQQPVEENFILETTIRTSSATKFQKLKKPNSPTSTESSCSSKESLGETSWNKFEQKEFCKTFSMNAKPHSYNSKCFKPRLEDIKSSYVLLNTKPTNDTHYKRTTKMNEKKPIPKLKPQPLNERQRQKQLKESKQKYRTKTYIFDSKYDKIEGLNWVSWK